jgi:hypothetical protein
MALGAFDHAESAIVVLASPDPGYCLIDVECVQSPEQR